MNIDIRNLTNEEQKKLKELKVLLNEKTNSKVFKYLLNNYKNLYLTKNQYYEELSETQTQLSGIKQKLRSYFSCENDLVKLSKL